MKPPRSPSRRYFNSLGADSLHAIGGVVSALALFPALLPTLAAAQDKGPQNPPANQASSTTSISDTQTVEVNGTLRHQDDTAGKQVVTRAAIEQYGDSNLIDVLRRQPGITIVGKQIQLNGLGNGYTQILINGDRVPAGFSIESLSPESIERIEILKSGSAEFSAQAIAGTINFVLRKTNSGATRQMKLGVIDAAQHFKPNASLYFADKDAMFSYSLSASFDQDHLESDSLTSILVRDAQGNSVNTRQTRAHWEFESKRLNLVPSLTWKVSENDQLSLQNMLQIRRPQIRNLATEDTELGSSSAYPSNDALLQVQAASVRSDLSWTHRFNAALKLDTKIGIDYTDTSRRQTFNGFQRSPTDTHTEQLALIRITDDDSTDKNWSNKGKFLWQAHEQHSLAIGWDLVYQHNDAEQIQSDHLNLAGTSIVPRENTSIDLRNLAFFVQDEWDLSPSVQIALGLRWEGIHTDIKGNNLLDTSRKFSIWNPIFQTLWKVAGSSDDQVRLALSRTYKAPNPRTLAPIRRLQLDDNNPTHPDFQGNPQLLPELASGLDLSYEHNLGKDASFGVSGFLKRIENFTLDRLTQQDGRWISISDNQGQARVHGLEMNTTLPASFFMDAAPALTIRLNATRNWSHIDRVPGPNNRIAYQTPFSATLAIDYDRTPMHKIGMNFSFQSGGLIRASEASSSYSNVTRSLELVSLWQLNKASKLRFTLGNALHQDSILGQYYQSSESNFRSHFVQDNHNKVKLMLEHSL